MMTNEQGQASVEFVLIASVLVSLSIGIYSELRKRDVFPSIVNGPSEYLRGMSESGVWAPAAQAKSQHPAYLKRKAATLVR